MTILRTVDTAHTQSGAPVRALLPPLGLPRATYYSWVTRQAAGTLADRPVLPIRTLLLPTPDERAAVCAFALAHPAMGYKRLTWLMNDRDVAYFRPSQVYRLLQDAQLLRRRPMVPPGLTRPPAPDHPDQVWHLDLMYLFVRPRWYYLVDILDGYSRFLVHWTLSHTLAADPVLRTVQEALERLPSRRPGEPHVIHDHGSQFVSGEWRLFITATGLTDIRTRVAHPESNGRVERLHRTHREEGLIDAEMTEYGHTIDALTRWGHYYNYERPHASLAYLCPIDYYRGDPPARLAERERKLAQAREARQAYWNGGPGGRNLSQN